MSHLQDNPRNRPELVDDAPTNVLARVKIRIEEMQSRQRQRLDFERACAHGYDVAAEVVDAKMAAVERSRMRAEVERVLTGDDGTMIAPESVEVVRERQLDISQLQTRLARIGLDVKVDGGIEAQVQAFAAAFADGAFGFEVDPRRLTFPEAKMSALEDALLGGDVNGALVTAYPTREQVNAIAVKAGIGVESLLDMQVTEFLAHHFERRGGTVADLQSRLEKWRAMCWATDGSLTPPTGYGTLPAQPRLRDVLGRAQLLFTNVARDVQVGTPLVQAVTASNPLYVSSAQGKGLTYERLAKAGASILAPDEWLALASLSTPGDLNTYPSPNTWEWLSGVASSCAAYGCSASGGLFLDWRAPERSGSNGRARSVVRGTPVVQGMDSGLVVETKANEDVDRRIDEVG